MEDFEQNQRMANLVNELRKNNICASAMEAERMAGEIITRETQTSKEHKEHTEKILERYDSDRQQKEEHKKSFITKSEFDSLIGINNKVIEANFVKLKGYTDRIILDLHEEIKTLKRQLEVPIEVPVKAKLQTLPKNEEKVGFTPEDVSIEKIFYYGNK